jgi:hypothetical protein
MEFRYGNLGLEWPKREDWIENIVKWIEHFVPSIPRDVWVIIAMYGATLGIKWKYPNESLEEITSIDALEPFSRDVDFPLKNAERFNVLLSCKANGHRIDLLSDMKWRMRSPCVCQAYLNGCICSNPNCRNKKPHKLELPRDAYVVDEENGHKFAIYVHFEQPVRGIVIFRKKRLLIRKKWMKKIENDQP